MQETWTIKSVSTKMLDGTFVAKLVGHDESNELIGELEAESKSLERLLEIIRPANPTNL